MTQKQNSTLPAIIVCILLFGMISFVTNLASPMGKVLEEEFNVAEWMGKLGVFCNFIAYAIMGIPAGTLLQKKGYKFTALTAVTVGFIGVGVQTCGGLLEGNAAFGVYLLGAFIAGFSMCMLNIVVNPMLNKLAGGGNRGNQLVQVGGSFNSLMGTATIMLTGFLLGDIVKEKVVDGSLISDESLISKVFPLMFAALAIFAVAFVVILLTKIPENPAVEAKAEEKSQYGPMSFRHFVLGAVAIFIYVGVEVGIPNLLNDWLITDDVVKITTEAAGVVTGTYWLLMLVGRLLGAALGAKVSAKAMLSTVSIVGLALVLGAIFLDPVSKLTLPLFDKTFKIVEVSLPINAVLLVLCGLCTSVMWGGIFNLAVEGLGKYTEKGSGIFMAMVCGGGILPLLQGAIVTSTGGNYLASYWVIIAGLAFLLYYALVGCKNVNKNIPTE